MQVNLPTVLLFSAIATINSGCFAAPYTFRIIEHSYTRLQAEGINDHDQVAGWYVDGGRASGFVYDNRRFTSIVYPGAVATLVNDINNLGHVVGVAGRGPGPGLGFVFEGQQFTPIVNPNNPEGGYIGHGINDSEQVVGQTEGFIRIGDVAIFKTYGFIYEQGEFTAIDSGEQDNDGPTIAYGNNNLGYVVGSYFANKEGYTAFVYANGVFSKFHHPEADRQTAAYDINDKGQIVGYYSVDSSLPRGFMYNGSTFQNIDFPGALGTVVTGINNSGTLIGSAIFSDRQLAFVAIPNETSVPEPSSLSTVASGLLIALCVKRL
jgi:probable HAF family extracellular repeat protein